MIALSFLRMGTIVGSILKDKLIVVKNEAENSGDQFVCEHIEKSEEYLKPKRSSLWVCLHLSKTLPFKISSNVNRYIRLLYCKTISPRTIALSALHSAQIAYTGNQSTVYYVITYIISALPLLGFHDNNSYQLRIVIHVLSEVLIKVMDWRLKYQISKR